MSFISVSLNVRFLGWFKRQVGADHATADGQGATRSYLCLPAFGVAGRELWRAAGWPRFMRPARFAIPRYPAGRDRRAGQQQLPEPFHIRVGVAGAVGHAANMDEGRRMHQRRSRCRKARQTAVFLLIADFTIVKGLSRHDAPMETGQHETRSVLCITPS